MSRKAYLFWEWRLVVSWIDFITYHHINLNYFRLDNGITKLIRTGQQGMDYGQWTLFRGSFFMIGNTVDWTGRFIGDSLSIGILDFCQTEKTILILIYFMDLTCIILVIHCEVNKYF